MLEDLSETFLALPSEERYENLKKTLISRFGASMEEKLDRLFGDCTLGELRPSELLTRMKALAGKELSASLVLKLW